MNYSHVELVLEIAAAGTISKAAENLYISQPSLSAALKSIEAEIGTPLFKRSKSGVEPTPFGKKYIQYAKDISIQIDLLNNLYKSQQVSSLRLDVVTEGFRFLTEALFLIRQKFIGTACTFHVAEASVGDQIEHVKNGNYEIGVLALPEGQKQTFLREIRAKGLEYHRMQDAIPGVYVKENSSTFPESITQIDREALNYLMEMPFFALHGSTDDMIGNRFQTALMAVLNRLNLKPKNPIITNHSFMKIDMLTQFDGFGEATYCPALYEKYSFFDGIRFIPFSPEFAAPAEIGWIQKQNQPRSPLANELILMLSE